MEKEQLNEIKDMVVDCTKKQTLNFFARYVSNLKKIFVCQGRATRADFWGFVIGNFILNFLAGMALVVLSYIFTSAIISILAGILALIDVFLVIGTIAVSIRRMHDLNLSGFWLWYLSSMGFPIVFIVNLLDLDPSCNNVLNRISEICKSWVAWILLPIFWFIGAPTVMLLLCLYAGKNEPNQYGPSPYAVNQ